jgi:hypothetical protein
LKYGEYTRLNPPENRSRLDLMLKCMLGTLLFCLCYFLATHSIYDCTYSDLRSHIRFSFDYSLKEIVVKYLTGQDFLWHTLVRLGAHVPGMNRNDAACIVTAAAYTATFFVSCEIMEREDAGLGAGAIPLSCFALSLVSAIYAPWYSSKIYMGSSSPNPWHSPTQIMVKPFAILLFAMTVMFYNRLRDSSGKFAKTVYYSRGEAVLYAVAIMFSVYAKPSFFQVLVPGLGILMVIDLIRSKGQSFLFSLKLAAAFVPGALLTCMMFFHTFLSGEGGGSSVEIAPFVVWKHYTDSIPFSTLLLLAFPLFVFVADWRSYGKSAESPLSVAILASGTLMKALLAETGSRRWHGNFSWGYCIATTVIWFAAMKKFLRMMHDEELSPRAYRITACVGWTLLALHLISGIIYVIQLGTGTNQC